MTENDPKNEYGRGPVSAESMTDFYGTGNSDPNAGQYGYGNPDPNMGQNIYGNPDPYAGQYAYGNLNSNAGQYVYGSPDPNAGQYAYGYPDPNAGQYVYGSPDPNAGQYVYGSPDPNVVQYGYGNPDPNAGQYAYGYPDPNAGQYVYGSPDPNAGQYAYGSPDPNADQYAYGTPDPYVGQFSYTGPAQDGEAYPYGNPSPVPMGGQAGGAGRYTAAPMSDPRDVDFTATGSIKLPPLTDGLQGGIIEPALDDFWDEEEDETLSRKTADRHNSTGKSGSKSSDISIDHLSQMIKGTADKSGATGSGRRSGTGNVSGKDRPAARGQQSEYARWRGKPYSQNAGRIFGVLRYGMILALAIWIYLQFAGSQVSTAPFATVSESVLAASDLSPMQEGSNQMVRRLYGLTPDDYDGILLYYPMTNMNAEELFMIKLRDLSQKDAVLASIASRLETQKKTFDGYGVDQYAMLENSVTDDGGNYILFVSAADPGAVKAAFEHALERGKGGSQ